MTIYNEACDCGKISAREVCLYYGSFQALRNITLEIPQCAITAIIGPSGCGKSSFLRMMNRMNDIINGVSMKGDLRLDGVSIYDKNVNVVDLRKRVGMVFQKPNPFPMSIFEISELPFSMNSFRRLINIWRLVSRNWRPGLQLISIL